MGINSLDIRDNWKGANGFSKFIAVLGILGIISSISATIYYCFGSAVEDYSKINFITFKEIKTANGVTIPIGTIVKVKSGDGVNFVLDYNGEDVIATLNEIKPKIEQ